MSTAHANWLINTPPSDPNFRSALQSAWTEDLYEALNAAAEAGQKTRYNAIRGRLNAHQKECLAEGGCGSYTPEPTWEESQAAIASRKAKESSVADAIVNERENLKALVNMLDQASEAALRLALDRCTEPQRQEMILDRLPPLRASASPREPLSSESLAECETQLIPGTADARRNRGEKRTATAEPEPAPTKKTSAAPVGASSEPKSELAVATGQSQLVTDDALMGAQLTEQYHRAVGGMREVLRFGAMMMALRDHLATVVQVRTTGGQFGEKSEGSVKKWLETNAPEVKSSTAFRFLHVAEAVAAEFQSPAKISFVELATSQPDELPEKFRNKQLELWEFVDGTSQRSWLDRFAPTLRGGARTSKKEKKTPEEEFQIFLRAARESASAVASGMQLIQREESYKVLNDAELDTLIHATSDILDILRAWQKTPKRDRQASEIAFLKHQS